MECKKVKELLPGYLDGALPSGAGAGAHVAIGRHLERCRCCREDLRQYVALASLMSQVQPSVPPADLALRIRIAASHRLAESDWLHYTRRAKTRAQLILENILEPLALPATGGLAMALLAFAVICQFLGLGVPLGSIANDSPTTLLQPARLETLAPFPITGLEASGHSGPHALLVEAIVNAEGQAVTYQILSGPDNPVLRRQLDQMLLFSRFRPQLNFGRPTSGGHVVLSFSDVSIKG